MFIKIFLLLLIINQFGYSQIRWFWQNPTPTLSELDNVYFITPEIGWITSSEGEHSYGTSKELLKTTDGGITWKYEYPGIDAFSDIYFVNEKIGFMSGQGKVLRTEDGGLNWVLIFSEGNNEYKIKFIDENIGVIAAKDLVYKTADGGKTWKRILNDNNIVISDVWCITDLDILIIGNNGKIRKTTDGGVLWDSIPNVLDCYYLTSIYFTDNLTGFITGHSGDYPNMGGIQKTTDGGNTWQVKISGNLDEIYFIDSLNGYAYKKGTFDNSEIFIKTVDGGENWQIWNVNNNINRNINKLFFYNEDNIFAAGDNGYVAKSNDEGNSWIDLYEWRGFKNLNLVNFYNYNLGIAVNAEGDILMTTDKGADWNISYTVNKQINCIHFIDDKNYILVGNNGLYVYTTDGGTTWSSKNIALTNLYSIQFLNKNFGIVVGDLATYMKTTNGGNSWSTSTSRSTPYKKIYLKDSLNFYVLGELNAATIMQSTNGGLSWKNLQFFDFYSDIDFADENNGIIVGTHYISGRPGQYFGIIMKTTDGGNSWIKSTMPLESDVYFKKIYYFDINNLYIITGTQFSNSTILKSSDGGNNWYYESASASDVHFIDIKTAYAVKGLTIRSTIDVNDDNIILPVKDNPYNNRIDNFSLSQNYPNPFNPTTKINYTLAKDGRASLIIYDVLGREVKKLFDEEKLKGNYNTEFNATELSSGIYFYRLRSNSFNEIKKMILIK